MQDWNNVTNVFSKLDSTRLKRTEYSDAEIARCCRYNVNCTTPYIFQAISVY